MYKLACATFAEKHSGTEREKKGEIFSAGSDHGVALLMTLLSGEWRAERDTYTYIDMRNGGSDDALVYAALGRPSTELVHAGHS